MSKIMIWVGQFPSEAEFDKYMDQSDFYKWWKEYDEDNKEMRCQFCKELGVMSYDEDFLIMKYAPTGMSELINLIPANTEKITDALKAECITDCNAVICYNCRSGISPQKAINTTSVKYIGSYEFDLNPTGVAGSLAGLEYLVWIGTTDKSREEFMEYFNQDEYLKELEDFESGITKKSPNPEHRCQFCKDIDIKYYYPEFLKVEILDHLENPLDMVKGMIENSLIPDLYFEIDIDREKVSYSNCIFCYIPNGFKDKKKNQKIFIRKKRYSDYETPKKHVKELSSYNGIKYLGVYKAD